VLGAARAAIILLTGDVEKAVEILRKKGIAKAAKRAGKAAALPYRGSVLNG
jgi:translation elongation factor EF-Ts